VLRGVNIGDLYHFRKFGGYRAPDFAYIADTMNANAVRIAVHPGLWKSDETANFAYLKENIGKALAAGLFVIVDYHTIGFPNGYVQPLDDKNIAYSADFDLAKDFWNTVSKDIKDGRVLFELWNEPVSSGNASLNDTAKWAVLKSYWEQLIRIIRNNGCSSVIIAGGDYWTFNLKGIRNNLLSDSNTAYAWHIYGGNSGNNTAVWENALDRLYEVKPVLVTEWGYSSNPGEFEYAAPETFADKFVNDFLIKKNLSSFAWGYDPWYTPSMLKDGNYYSLSSYGQYVVDYLKSCNQARP
jgi:hypothetical protein